jgi:DNA-binding transcriptional regulator YiaG
MEKSNIAEYSIKVGRYTVIIQKEGDKADRISANLLGELELMAAFKVLQEQKDIGGEELKFVRHALMMDRETFSQAVGVTLQEVCDWEEHN